MSTYKHFGVMIDCSRNAVPKVSAVKEFINCLQKMGYDTLELYTEDTYEVESEPYFGYLRGRYSGKEIKEIDQYASAHGIELIPCIQTLAHFTNLVKLPRFRDITDINDILLIDEEKTYEFIERIFASLAANFTSRNVHIGMDEAHMVGLGKYLDKHGICDRFEILNRHLSRVVDIAKKYGFTPHMWSDMFFRLIAHGDYYNRDAIFSDAVARVLPDVALTYWDYYHVEEKHYDAMIELHKKFGKEIWFAGGAQTWSGFVPQTRFAYATMQAAMRSVRKQKIENVLITMWGDNGGECSPFAALQVLYTVRRYAEGIYDNNKIAAEFAELFGVSYDDFELLALPDNVPDNNDVNILFNPSKVLLYSDPFLGIFDSVVDEHSVIPYGEYAKQLSDAKSRSGKYIYLFNTAEQLCRLMELKAYLGVRTRKVYHSGDKNQLKELIVDYIETETRLEIFYNIFAHQWQQVNKPFGFEVHCARLGGLKQRLAYCRQCLQDYAEGKSDRIEELEENILPFDPVDTNSIFMNDYRRLVSVSEL